MHTAADNDMETTLGGRAEAPSVDVKKINMPFFFFQKNGKLHISEFVESESGTVLIERTSEGTSVSAQGGRAGAKY